jgi:hypothetical protein
MGRFIMTSEEQKKEFLFLVHSVLRANPTWLGETLMAIHSGTMEGIDDMVKAHAKVEMGLAALLENKRTMKIKGPRRERLLEGVKHLRYLGGTLFQEKVLKLFEGKEDESAKGSD